MAKRVITFGEIMMRLNPIGYLRLVQSDRFEATYAGGEANVAVSLANYGLDAAYVTKVPAHEVGQCAVNELRRYGVDTQYMVRGGDRLGIYFCEKGASQRASKVIYDRASSAIALAKRTDFDWDTIFDGADWFHWTGITPALGGELPEICLDACKAAKARGLTISCDLNFRKKLWTSQRAGEVMSQLLPYVDVASPTKKTPRTCSALKPRARILTAASSTATATSAWHGSFPPGLAANTSPSPCAAPFRPTTTTGPVCSMKPRQTRRTSPPHTMCTLSTASAAAIPLAAA